MAQPATFRRQRPVARMLINWIWRHQIVTTQHPPLPPGRHGTEQDFSGSPGFLSLGNALEGQVPLYLHVEIQRHVLLVHTYLIIVTTKGLQAVKSGCVTRTMLSVSTCYTSISLHYERI